MLKSKRILSVMIILTLVLSLFTAVPTVVNGAVNIALNKTAAASSYLGGNTPAAAFDGNTGTRWESAFSDPQWISVDLGSSYSVTGVKLIWETAAGKDYKIQVSPDNATWTDAYTKTGGIGGTENITFTAPVNGRYVRMYGTARTTGYGYSLWEFEVYNTQDSTVNIALNKTAASSSNQGANTAAAAFDGNGNTRWESAFTDPQWISVDLGSSYSVTGVKLYWETAAGKDYKIQVSPDNATWTDAYTKTGGIGGTENITFTAPVTGKYVRMYGTARTTGYGYSLWEFEVYGTGAANSVATPVITPATGTYASAQTVTITDGTAGAAIRYTTNGSNPTATTGTVYSGPFTVSATTTVKAIAYKAGMTDSAIATSVITIGTGSIGIPTGLTVGSVTNNSVSLSWAAVSGATGYNVYRSFASGGTYTKVNGAVVTATGYTNTGLDTATYYYKVSAVNGSGESSLSVPVTATTTLDFGPNVKIFDPSMSSASIQSTVDGIFNQMEQNQFGSERYALFFKPGAYNVNLAVGYYTSVYGLGQRPDDVTITGSVRCEADWMGGNATCNFWRSVENLADVPTYSANPVAPSGTETWGVSQAAPMRRVHIKGSLTLWDPNPQNYDGSWSSGGFIADSLVDGQISSGSQQQYLTRNSQMGSWTGSNWNMVFVGNINAPSDTAYPNPAYTTFTQTPVIREKPFVYLDGSGKYNVFVPALRTNAQGITWASGIGAGTSLGLDQFVIAHPGTSTAASLNAALSQGKNILFTPGIYHLSAPLNVTNANTVVLGLGLATLIPDNGTAAMTVADVDGVKLAGILFDAGANNSPVLLQVGPAGSSANHAANPTTLSDLFFRVGGAGVGKADLCLAINSNNVIGDNFWVWRADHGTGVGWTVNPAAVGMTVNGNDVTLYGLFVEHFQQYQTVWNGNGGRTYFYQSEMPYDVPNQASWMSNNGTVNGYASYKVANSVTSHNLYGSGVYSFFNTAVVWANTGIEVPNTPNVKVYHACSVFLAGNGGINHVVNNTGATAQSGAMRQTVTQYP